MASSLLFLAWDFVEQQAKGRSFRKRDRECTHARMRIYGVHVCVGGGGGGGGGSISYRHVIQQHSVDFTNYMTFPGTFFIYFM